MSFIMVVWIMGNVHRKNLTGAPSYGSYVICSSCPYQRPTSVLTNQTDWYGLLAMTLE